MRADRPASRQFRRGGLAPLFVSLGLAAAPATAQTARLGDAWEPVTIRNGMCLFSYVRFAPDGKSALSVAMGTGMCVSHDGGRSWRFWWGGESEYISTWLADGSTITLVADGFALSRDVGLSAEIRQVPGASVYAMHRDGRRGITVTENGQIRLTDDRWASLRTIGGLSSQKGIGAAIAPDGQTLVAVFAEYWMLTGTIAVSRDFGATWTLADLPRNSASPGHALFAFDGTGILMQVDENLLYSADGGRRWWPLSLAGFQPYGEYAFSENLATLLVRDEEGLLLVQPAAAPRWNARRVLAVKNLKSIALSADGRVGAVVTEEGELYFSHDSGNSWAPARARLAKPSQVSLSPDGRAAIVAVEPEKDSDPRAFISVTR